MAAFRAAACALAMTLAACTLPPPAAPGSQSTARAPASAPAASSTSTPPPAPPPAPASAAAPASAPSVPSAQASKAATVRPAPKAAATAPAAVAPAAAKPAASAPPLDLASLEQKLKDTPAIGVMTKLSLRNQVNDLLDQFRAYYAGRMKTSLADLRRPYELLLMKVLSLLQDSDPALAQAIHGSREAIWGILSDPQKFAKVA